MGSHCVISLYVSCVLFLWVLLVGFSVVSIYMVLGSDLSLPLGRVCFSYSYLWWMELFLDFMVLGYVCSWDLISCVLSGRVRDVCLCIRLNIFLNRVGGFALFVLVFV